MYGMHLLNADEDLLDHLQLLLYVRMKNVVDTLVDEEEEEMASFTAVKYRLKEKCPVPELVLFMAIMGKVRAHYKNHWPDHWEL